MAWTNPETFTAGQTLTAASMNAISDNLRAGGAAMVQVRRTTTQSTSNVTWAHVSFDASATYDTDSMFASGTPTYVTVNTAGIYLITAQVAFANNGAGARLVYIEKNAPSPGTGTALSYANAVPQNVSDQTFAIAATVPLVATDKVYLSVYQSSGGNLNLVTNPYQSLCLTWLAESP